MDWQSFLYQLNTEYKDLALENPPIEIYGSTTGHKFEIVEIYNEDGIICIDIQTVEQ